MTSYAALPKPALLAALQDVIGACCRQMGAAGTQSPLPGSYSQAGSEGDERPARTRDTVPALELQRWDG